MSPIRSLPSTPYMGSSGYGPTPRLPEPRRRMQSDTDALGTTHRPESTMLRTMESRFARIEQRLYRLEHPVGSVHPDRSSSFTSYHAPPTMNRSKTPDEFNPFWDEDEAEASPLPGVHAFPEAVLCHRPTFRHPGIGASFHEQLQLYNTIEPDATAIDWDKALAEMARPVARRATSPTGRWPAKTSSEAWPCKSLSQTASTMPLTGAWTSKPTLTPDAGLPLTPVRSAKGVRTGSRLPSQATPTKRGWPSHEPADLVHQVLAHQSQEASIALQRTLKSTHPLAKNKICDAIRPKLVRLALDRNGTYLVQRALHVDATLAQDLKGSYARLAQDACGMHVVQHVLDHGSSAMRETIAREMVGGPISRTLLAPCALPLWHTLFTLVWEDPVMPGMIRDSIEATFQGEWLRVITHEAGTVLCQHMLTSHFLTEESACVDVLLRHIVTCSCDPSGVWVVQCLVEQGSAAIRDTVCARILRYFPQIVMSPYGAKVVQAILRLPHSQFAAACAEQLCPAKPQSAAPGSERPLLLDLALVPQGLVIVFQLLTTVEKDRQKQILDLVHTNASQLKSNKNGMRVYQLCERARQ